MDSAITVTGIEQQQCWDERRFPKVEQVGPGTWSIPLPLPIEALRYVLCYVLEGADGLTVVDPGWGGAEGFAALEAGLSEIGSSLSDIELIAVTHFHPDHAGLVSQLRAATGASVAIHSADFAELRRVWSGAEPWKRRTATMLTMMGAPDEDVENVTSAGPNGIWGEEFEPEILLEDDALVPIRARSIRTVWTPGHTPGHVCYVDEQSQLLLTGDHILARVTPNITVPSWPISSQVDPLGDYLHSLERLWNLDPPEVLPAHYWRFSNLDARIAEIKDHHRARLDDIEQAVGDGSATAWNVASHLKWSRDWDSFPPFAKRSALGETLAHLVYLERLGRARHFGDSTVFWERA